MDQMKRFAVYYAPRPGPFSDRANDWLGRDPVSGQMRPQPDLGLPAADITTAPRRYGFHGTLKAPFRLAPDQTPQLLDEALHRLAQALAPVNMPGLWLARLGGFLALLPQDDATGLSALAARVVADLDPFRAPLTEAEIARRHPERLTPRQRELLDLWGYPFVMEEFRFHLTLTNHLDADLAERTQPVLTQYFAPVLPRPFVLADLCLFGETRDGTFRLLHRHALSG